MSFRQYSNTLFILILLSINFSIICSKSFSSSKRSCSCTEDKLLVAFNGLVYTGDVGKSKHKGGYKSVLLPKNNAAKKTFLDSMSKNLPGCIYPMKKALRNAVWLVRDSRVDAYVLSLVVNNKRVIIIRGTKGLSSFAKLGLNLRVTRDSNFRGKVLKFGKIKVNRIKRVLDSFLSNVPERKLILSGHSQGGGIVYAYTAYLFKKKHNLVRKFKNNINIVTFAGIWGGDIEMNKSFCTKTRGRNYITSAYVNNDRVFDAIYYANKGDVNFIFGKRGKNITIPYYVRQCRPRFSQIILLVKKAGSKAHLNWFKTAKRLEKKACKVKRSRFFRKLREKTCKVAKKHSWVAESTLGWYLHVLYNYSVGLNKRDTSKCLA